MRKKWVMTLLLGLLVVVCFVGASYYQTKIYFQKNGNEMVVSKGGKISVKTDGIINFENGSKLQIGGGDLDIGISKIAVYNKLVDFATIETGLSEQTFTCNGVSTGDIIFLNDDIHLETDKVAIVSASVPANNTVKVRFLSLNGEVDPETMVLKIVAVK